MTPQGKIHPKKYYYQRKNKDITGYMLGDIGSFLIQGQYAASRSFIIHREREMDPALIERTGIFLFLCGCL